MFVSFIQFIFDLYLDQFGVAGLARRPAGAGGRRLEDESHCVVLSSISSIFCLPSPCWVSLCRCWSPARSGANMNNSKLARCGDW